MARESLPGNLVPAPAARASSFTVLLVALVWDLVVSFLACVALYVGATFLGDIVHYGLHRAARSRFALFSRIGSLHEAHHRFLGRDLRIHREHAMPNLVYHRLPEYLTQLLATALGFAFLPGRLVLVVLAFETVLVAVGTIRGGLDSNHSERPHRLWSIMGLFVGPLYHARHHVYPERYIGSTTRLFDVIFGTGCQIRGRSFAMTGASGALGAPLARMLEAEGGRVLPLKYGRDYEYENYDRAQSRLAEADVLVLCHGSKVKDAMDANCTSFIALIERFRRAHEAQATEARGPVEVWAVGSEIEAHPAWGDPDLEIYARSKRAYARCARRYFRAGDFLYRHIVPSAYTSPMGKGFISGETAAAIAMFFIRRGFRYVPVTYTGIACINWLRYAWPRAEGRASAQHG